MVSIAGVKEHLVIPQVYPIKKFVKSLIVIGLAGLIIIFEDPISANQNEVTEQQKCVVYLKKCFSQEDYDYLYDFSTLTTGECFASCKSTYDEDDNCGFDMCFEMCKVAAGISDEACPIPTDPPE